MNFGFGFFITFLFQQIVFYSVMKILPQRPFRLFWSGDSSSLQDSHIVIIKINSLISHHLKNSPGKIIAKIPINTEDAIPKTMTGPAIVNIFAQSPKI